MQELKCGLRPASALQKEKALHEPLPLRAWLGASKGKTGADIRPHVCNALHLNRCADHCTWDRGVHDEDGRVKIFAALADIEL